MRSPGARRRLILSAALALVACAAVACGDPEDAVDLAGATPVSLEPGSITLGTLPSSGDAVLGTSTTGVATRVGVTTAPAVTDPNAPPPTTVPIAVPPSVDPNNPATQARPIPSATPVEVPPPPPVGPPWAASTRTTGEGYVVTDVGCAASTDAAGLDAFFAERVGPMIGSDYQHVYPLGGDRYLWLFQDTFIDHTGGATKLNQASFIHNSAMVQTGKCFQSYHRGSPSRPSSFEEGAGERALERWFWPMGGEVSGRRLSVFWVEMHKDPYDPSPPDGLGWHPARTWLATYDTNTLGRLSFDPARNDDVRPIYGYATASDATWTYLFGNTFEQNMVREGGFWARQHSGTSMWLGRVPRGSLNSVPEYWSTGGWSTDRASAQPFLTRHWAENPMQPRFIDGQWVSVSKVDGYWGENLMVDVAPEPWGPWTTVEHRQLSPRTGDAKMNTYHVHLLPWRESNGSWVMTFSNNARNMMRDAVPSPWRYRISAARLAWAPVPPPPPPPETTTTTELPTTTTELPTTTTVPPTTVPPTTTTTVPPTTTTLAPSTSSTTTTLAPSTSSTSTTVPPTTAAAASTVARAVASTLP